MGNIARALPHFRPHGKERRFHRIDPSNKSKGRTSMMYRNAFGAIALTAALGLAIADLRAQEMSKFPTNWEGQWGRGSRVGIWDNSKPPGLGQQAPLTPEYQAILEANIKKQAEGKDFDPKGNCYPPGMPRLMMIYQPMEIVIKPKAVYFLLEAIQPIRRVHTDGRKWPDKFLPAYNGYSIGEWQDTDGDGRYDTLNIETRSISGPRLMDNAGIQLHDDNSTVVKEKIYLDKANPNIMRNEITTIDNAFTRPWTVTRFYNRGKDDNYAEYNCEDKHNIVIGGEMYWLGIDGLLMPTMKNQPPPDLRHFQAQR
jgi:hypothetical protein